MTYLIIEMRNSDEDEEYEYSDRECGSIYPGLTTLSRDEFYVARFILDTFKKENKDVCCYKGLHILTFYEFIELLGTHVKKHNIPCGDEWNDKQIKNMIIKVNHELHNEMSISFDSHAGVTLKEKISEPGE